MLSKRHFRYMRWLPLVLLWPLGSCSPAESSAEEQDTTAAPPQIDAVRVTNVEARPVELTSFTNYIRITGEVEAFHDLTLAAEESGVVTQLFLERGDRVGVGEPVARLDTVVIAAQVRDARAAASLAHEQYQRQRQLWEEDRIGSEIAYLQARYGWERAEAQLKMLEARMAKTLIKSPVSGVLDDRYMEVGEMASVGTPVVRIVATRRVKIVGGIPERFAQSVDPGDRAVVSFDILPDREFAGEIRFVGSAVDEASRTFPIEIWMDNPQRLVKAHMVANVQVVRDRMEEVIVIPQTAVVRASEGYQVFVVEDRDGHPVADARSVVLGPSYSSRVVILEGLEPGDLLVHLGQQLVDDGSLIRIVNPDTVAEGR